MSGSEQLGQAIAACAETWIDVPFHWQGRTRAGVDCKGLLAGVLAELGLPAALSVEALAGDYDGRVPLARLKAGLARMFDPADERQAALRQAQGERIDDGRMPGDILLCRLRGLAQHLAIAAPLPGLPDRAIEAMPSSPGRVRPATWPAARVDSVWRLRQGEGKPQVPLHHLAGGPPPPVGEE